MIQYTTNLPSKVDYYELLKTVYEDIDVSGISTELENSIACVCVYNGDRLVGMGRVKREKNYLCIEDLIVNLFTQLNQIKNYDIAVRDCLSMKMSNEEVTLSEAINQNVQVNATVNSLQLNGVAGI